MQHTEGRFTGARGRSIYYQVWRPEGMAKAVVVIAHGAAEHSGRYQPLAEFLTARGYAVAGLDHAGHGRTEGPRAHVERFADLVADFTTFIDSMGREFPGLPRFLFGHSMGGLIACCYLLQHQDELAGCILSGPAITTELKPGLVQMTTVRVLAALFPKLGALQLDASGVSRDPAEVQTYLDDPLNCTGKLSARLVAELFGAMQQVQEGAAAIRLPLLLLHGGADAMTDPKGSEFLAGQVGSADKMLKIYPGLYHEILREPERDEVMNDILAWLERRLG